MNNKIPSLQELLHKHNINTKKSLGQNFLIDANIITNIIKLAGNLDNVNIIEIGGGAGSLTRELIFTNAASVTTIELDKRCIPLQQELATYANGKLNIIEGDALDISVKDIASEPRYIIANLPYNIATALLIKWLQEIYINPKTITSMTLMFQKEVAKRITAEPNSKAYGRLSILTNLLCNTEYGFDVPPEAFIPAPKITSTVIYLVPLKSPRYKVNLKMLEQVLAVAFNQRRKMLRTSLKPLNVQIDILLEKANIDPTRRAETLNVQEFCNLANIYEKHLGS